MNRQYSKLIGMCWKSKLGFFIALLLFFVVSCSSNGNSDVAGDRLFNNIGKVSTNLDNRKYWSDDSLVTLRIGSGFQFSYPSNKLKVQGSIRKMLIDSVRNIMELPYEKKIALESKLNNNYVNILLQTTTGAEGDFISSNFRIAELSYEEQQMAKAIFLDREKRTFEMYGVEIKKWYPVQLDEINGCFCIKLEYIRESKLGDDVHVWLAYFPDRDIEYALSTSCRINNVSNWQLIFKELINSARII